MVFKNTIYKISFSIAVIAFIFFVSVFSVLDKRAEAQVGSGSTELYGEAWSENVGWISFNYCENIGVNCGVTEYSVSVDNRSGAISGEAWSENVGWLQFGGLSSFPSGSGTLSENAKVVLKSGPNKGKITGWARFCAGTLNGDCSTMTDSIEGWDGWVSLSGNLYSSPDVSGNSGVTYDSDTNKIVGKAWGGDVLGWIDFWDVSFGPPEEFDYELSNPTEAPGDPVSVIQGGNGFTSVTRTLLSGDTENVTLILDDLPANIDVSIDDNQPCSPDCSSALTITDQGASPGSYSFDVEGDVLAKGVVPTTEVRFEIVEPEPEAEVTCKIQNNSGPFYIPGHSTVTWVATVEDEQGDEEYIWEGDDGLSCIGDVTECRSFDKTYNTVGVKKAQVSIDGGLNFAECETVIGIRMTFGEF